MNAKPFNVYMNEVRRQQRNFERMRKIGITIQFSAVFAFGALAGFLFAKL